LTLQEYPLLVAGKGLLGPCEKCGKAEWLTITLDLTLGPPPNAGYG